MNRQARRFDRWLAVAVLAVLASLSGCGSDSGRGSDTAAVDATGAKKTPAESALDVAAAIDGVIARDGQIQFESRPQTEGPKGVGVRLTLSPDAVARVEYLGDDPAVSTGTYRIDGDDRLRLDFGPDDPWLPMKVEQQEGAILITAPEKSAVIEAAVAAGIPADAITDEEFEAAFLGWPLRYSP